MAEFDKYLDCLSQNDKQIFLEAIEDTRAGKGFAHAYSMSIFSKRGEIKTLGLYQYRDLSGETIYYQNRSFKEKHPLFFDVEGKIFPESNINLAMGRLLVKQISKLLPATNSFNSESYVRAFDGMGLGIQSWFITYGHFHDEVFALSDFRNKIQSDLNIILDYPPSDYQYGHTKYRTSANYERLQDLAFKKNSYNLHEAGLNLVKMDGCLLISHTIEAPTFHLFPKKIRNQLVKRTKSFQLNSPTSLFLSREVATHLPRNISNQVDIENHCRSSKVLVCYPERISFDRLVRYLSQCKSVVITWGGAMTNLVYLPDHANVLVLKSKSYQHENLELFMKIINDKKLNIFVIESDSENNIPLDQFNQNLLKISSC